MQFILQDLNIGANILGMRKKRGRTQEQVVAQLQLRGSSMSRSTYSKIETGTRNLKASDLILLKDVFGVPYDAFFAQTP